MYVWTASGYMFRRLHVHVHTCPCGHVCMCVNYICVYACSAGSRVLTCTCSCAYAHMYASILVQCLHRHTMYTCSQCALCGMHDTDRLCTYRGSLRDLSSVSTVWPEGAVTGHV